MRRVHVTSLAPRSGTTLMMELMVSGFVFDAYADHELRVYVAPDRPVDGFCSKYPVDLSPALRALRWHRDLWVICVMRDPRDVVVSRHARAQDRYWANLGMVTKRLPHLRAGLDHPRFVVVRYEELVADPDGLQDRIAAAIPWLERRAPFSAFAEVAKPTERSIEALGGVRQISTDSIGRWREELPRLKAQIERYGGIDEVLTTCGYEPDGSWRGVLDGVVADNGASQFEDRPERTSWQSWRRKMREYRCEVRGWLGVPIRTNRVVVASAH